MRSSTQSAHCDEDPGSVSVVVEETVRQHDILVPRDQLRATATCDHSNYYQDAARIQPR